MHLDTIISTLLRTRTKKRWTHFNRFDLINLLSHFLFLGMESNIGFTYAINQFRWVLLFAHKKREFQIILLGPTWISTEVHSFFRSNASNVTVSSLWAIGFMGLAVFFFSPILALLYTQIIARYIYFNRGYNVSGIFVWISAIFLS